MRELRLFSDWFLPQILDGSALEDAQADYVSLWRDMLKAVRLEARLFVHRDYHADNLMWLEDRSGIKRVGLLDFQDALAGDAAYDLVSLLEDARRDVPLPLADELKQHYLQRSGADAISFSAAYALLAAQRNCKIVGIFTRLAARDGKQHYLDYLPRVWGHLNHDLEHPLMASLARYMNQYIPVMQRGAIKVQKTATQLGLCA